MGSVYRVDTLHKELAHILGGVEQDDMRFIMLLRMTCTLNLGNHRIIEVFHVMFFHIMFLDYR